MSRSSLLSALLPEDSYQRLYAEHSGFHFAVDGLVGMLPGLVAGMASQALKDEAGRLEVLQEVRDQAGEITWSASSGPPEVPEAPLPAPRAIAAPRKRTARKAPSQRAATKKATRRR